MSIPAAISKEVNDRLASAGADGAALNGTGKGKATEAPAGAKPSTSSPAPASPPSGPAAAHQRAVARAASASNPAAARGGGRPSSDGFRGMSPERQAQMRRMNALTNATAAAINLSTKPKSVRELLALAAVLESWLATGRIP